MNITLSSDLICCMLCCSLNFFAKSLVLFGATVFLHQKYSYRFCRLGAFFDDIISLLQLIKLSFGRLFWWYYFTCNWLSYICMSDVDLDSWFVLLLVVFRFFVIHIKHYVPGNFPVTRHPKSCMHTPPPVSILRSFLVIAHHCTHKHPYSPIYIYPSAPYIFN